MNRFVVFILAATLLAGCSASDSPSFSASIAAPRPGLAQVVILYPAPALGSGSAMQVKLDQNVSCLLESGSYMVTEIAPGTKTIIFSMCGLPPASPFTFQAVAGEKYYLQVMPYDSSVLGRLSGYPNALVPLGAPLHRGPIQIERLEEREALQKIQSLKRE